jgi:hypothetical protein
MWLICLLCCAAVIHTCCQESSYKTVLQQLPRQLQEIVEYLFPEADWGEANSCAMIGEAKEGDAERKTSEDYPPVPRRLNVSGPF